MSYNPWPNGRVPEELQRPELKQLRQDGYNFDDAREVVTIFEQKVAAFANSKYAVAVDCCTHAMELALRYQIHAGQIRPYHIIIPENTYVSVPIMLSHLGFLYRAEKQEWSGVYKLGNTRVWDGAVRWSPDMYVGFDALHCLSFQIKKTIPIGRGGMVLTNDKEAADWIRLAAYDGRDLKTPYDNKGHVKFRGYHYYMTPEDAARGIWLMDRIETRGDTGDWTKYPNVNEMLKGI